MQTPTVEKPKKSRTKATIRERRLASLVVENSVRPKPLPLYQLAEMAGYSPASANNASAFLKRPVFSKLLELIDDVSLLDRVMDIALDEDKRSSLQAIDMLLKLKDRYPASKLKMQGFLDEIGAISDDSSDLQDDSPSTVESESIPSNDSAPQVSPPEVALP